MDLNTQEPGLDSWKGNGTFCLLQSTQIGSGTVPTQIGSGTVPTQIGYGTVSTQFLMLWVSRVSVLLGQSSRSTKLPNYLYIGRNVEVETVRRYTSNPSYAFVERCLINPADKLNFTTKFINVYLM